MQIINLISERLAAAISQFSPDAVALANQVRPTQDKSHGDFQINCAMALAKRLSLSPPVVAQRLVEHLQLDDVCESMEIAGPGFINLKLRADFIAAAAARMLRDERLDIEKVTQPARIVIDYSSPNVAKPMHVGHIRSCFIGDSLAKILRFLGHEVITDNHLGDWGTQFGMVIYGYRNFLDHSAFKDQPVPELLRVYRIVNSLIDAAEATEKLTEAQKHVEDASQEFQQLAARPATTDKAEQKKTEKAVAQAKRKLDSATEHVQSLTKKIEQVQGNPTLAKLATEHPQIAEDVLRETAKLHAGDEANIRLWRDLLPHCMDEINRVYDRLDIQFDYVLGESHYHDMLPGLVEQLRQNGLAVESEGATCIFLPGYDAPMIVQKKDGAFLYATTDLATIEYRQREFQPDEILYVVDVRQSEHFQKLFAAAKLLGYENIRLEHVSFGTVLDESGRPLKTRSGTLAGLTELLDDAVAAAHAVVCDPDRTQKIEPPLTADEQGVISDTVGIGAIKYADLSHHRSSDYKFSLSKMVALTGNTSAYVQYAYARIQGVLRSAETSEAEVINKSATIVCNEPAERELLLAALKLEGVLQMARQEYAPNYLVDYLYEIAKLFASMYDQCHVLNASSPELRDSRLAILALVGKIIRTGLAILGIKVVPRM